MTTIEHQNSPHHPCENCEYILDLYFQEDITHVWTKRQDGTTSHYPLAYHPQIYVATDNADAQYSTPMTNRGLEEIKAEVSKHPYVTSTEIVQRYLSSSHDKPTLVCKVEIISPKRLPEVVKDFRGKRFVLFNIDLNPRQQFFIDTQSYPMGASHIHLKTSVIQEHTVPIGALGLDFIEMHDDPTGIYYNLPKLSIIDIKPQIKYSGSFPGFRDPLSNIKVTIRDFENGEENHQTLQGTERQILIQLIQLVQHEDPDFINVVDGDKFVLNYLAHRAASHRLTDCFILGRLKIPLYPRKNTKGSTYMTYGQIMRRDPVWYIPGRVHLDAENSFFMYEAGLAGLFDLSRMGGVPPERTSRSSIGSALTGIEFQINATSIPSTLVPPNKATGEQFKPAEHLLIADNGGLIYPARPGVYDRVWALDFTSLYPMIMAIHNIGSETVLCDHKSCKTDDPILVPEVNYHICKLRVGIVPKTMFLVLQKRLLLKMTKKKILPKITKERFKGVDSALKWILVSCLEGSTRVFIRKNGIRKSERLDLVVNEFSYNDKLEALGMNEDGQAEFKPVRNVIKIKPKTSVYCIEFHGGKNVIATADHLWPVITENGWLNIRTDQLSLDHSVPRLEEFDYTRKFDQFSEWPTEASGILELARKTRKTRNPCVTQGDNISKLKLSKKIAQIKRVSHKLSKKDIQLLNRLETLSKSPISFSKVTKIELLAEAPEYVYCLQLDHPDPWFMIQGGLITHNCFGYLGFKNARWGSIESHQCVTAYARRYLLEARNICEDLGFEIIGGITDSLFVRARDPKDDTQEKINKVLRVVTQETGIPLDCEGRFQWVVFCNIRDYSGVSALNRYFGYFDHGEFKLRGIKHRQRRACKLEKDFQEAILEHMAHAESVEQFKERIVSANQILLDWKRKILNRQISPFDLVIKLKSTRGANGYRATSTVQALTVEKYRQLGKTIEAGQSFYYLVADDSVKTIDRITIGPNVTKHSTYDVESYCKLVKDNFLELLEAPQYMLFGEIRYDGNEHGVITKLDDYFEDESENKLTIIEIPIKEKLKEKRVLD